MTSKFLVQSDTRSCTADNLCALVRGSLDLIMSGKASTLRQDAEECLGSVNGGRSVVRYPSPSLNDFYATVLQPFLLPTCQRSSFELMKIGFKLS